MVIKQSSMESLVNNTFLAKHYQGKKVFITGHTGFKGSWLALWLQELGAQVKGYALAPNSKKDLFNFIDIESTQSVIDDIRNKQKIEDEIIKFRPDYIFHLAAQPLVRESYINPIDTFDINVIGTGNVLQAVRKLEKPCHVICITTDKVYDNKEWEYPYRENDRLGGYDPYSASKAGSEIIINSFKNSFFNDGDYPQHQKTISSVRAGNVIGGGDFSKDRIIPDIIRSLEKNETIVLRNPNAIRPWQHVLEPLGGYLLLGALLNENHTIAGAYNFGPISNDVLSVKELTKIAIEIWGDGKYDCPKMENQPHEANILKLDISKANNLLKWQPKLNSKESISWTLDWYRASENEKKVFALNQIKKYQHL